MGDNDDIIKEFLVESRENLDKMDRHLVALEKNPSSRELLADIFRSAHTIKGTCGFFGFSKLEAVTHAGESLLSLLRDGKIVFNSNIASALLLMVDAIRKILTKIETTTQEGDGDYTAVIETLQRAQKEGAGSPPSSAPEKPSENPASDIMAETLSTAADSHIRVDVNLLDKLMNLVGELVLARNQILQFTSTMENASLLATSQRLNMITTELQEHVMKTRMQPIGKIFSRFPRMVRDLALSLGKQVHLVMEGENTELDKTLVEAINDPLTHLVRNAVDHGIEPAQTRQAAGKPAEGKLFLRAYHEGGQVNIEMSDDGGGINVEKVRQKALQQGLISQEQAENMGEREIMNLIFLPGFSTAEKVTNVSGRGVGMDVVKTNIEKIGGTIDVQSVPGQGTTLKIKIPLTLAIIPALIVTCAGERYAIPQVSLLELVRLEGGDTHQGIEKIHGVPVYRLRGNLLPLVYLRQELGLGEAQGAGGGAGSVNIVVLQAGDHPFGLVVDGVNDTEEIVVKPLGKQLKGINALAGVTIMGDGRVALILDVLGLALKANVLTEVHERLMSEKQEEGPADAENRQTLLLFQTPDDGRMALPLSKVARLEEFPRAQLEKVGEQEVVQYRGEILPLIHLADTLPERRRAPRNPEAHGKREGSIQVVVYTHGQRSMGLVVDHILDIVDQVLTPQKPGSREGVTGSAVIQNRVTELLDVEGVIRVADPAFFETGRNP